jgi:hypothetical protein
MNEENLSNVVFAKTIFIIRATLKHKLNQFMRKRKHSSVRFVTTVVL